MNALRDTKSRVVNRPVRAVLLMATLSALAFVLLAGAAFAAPPWSDAPNSWWVGSYGVTDTQAGTVADGYDDGTFRSWLRTSRAQFTKMVVDGFSLGLSYPAVATFFDVLLTDHYSPWIEGAIDAAIVSGFPDGSFSPDTAVSRQQANSILARFLARMEVNLTGHIRGTQGIYGSLSAWYATEGPGVLSRFADAGSLLAVHVAGTAYLVHKGVVQGNARMGGLYLDPATDLARSQAVALILRVKNTSFVTTGLHLHVAVASNPAIAGAASGVTVSVVDEADSPVTGYTGTIRFTSTDPAAVLPANYQFTASDAGTHTFPGGVTFKTAGAQSVAATDTGSAVITGSRTVTVDPAAATKVVIEDAPTAAGIPVGSKTIVAGDHLDVYANSHDQFDNFVAPVAATWSLIDRTGGVVPADLAPAGGDKRAVFTGHLVGTGKIRAAATGLAADTTDTVTVVAGGAAKVVIEDAPTAAGIPVGSKTIVAGDHLDVYANSHDQFDNFVANVAATWSLIDRTGGVVPADLAPAAGNKRAVFTGHLVGTAKIRAAAIGLTAGTTGTITVTADAATKVVIEDAPDGSGAAIGARSVTAGSSLTAYTIARDAYDNFVANVAAAWSLINRTGGVVAGDLVPAAGSKSAVFTGRVIGTGVIRAVVGALADNSGVISVNPGPAAALEVQAPSSADAGTSFTVTVTAKDAYGNTATGYRGTIQFSSDDPGTETLPANYSFLAGDAGVRVFTDGVTLVTAGSRTVDADDTVNGAINGSATVTVDPGPADTLEVQAPATATAGAPFTVTVVVRDQYGNTAAGYVGTIQFSSSDPGAVLPPNYTFTVVDAGVQTFTGGVTLSAAGPQTVDAVDTLDGTINGSDTVNVS